MGIVRRVPRPGRHLPRQPPPQGFRRGAGPLCGRQRVFRVRPGVPLLNVADEAAHPSLLAARLAVVLRAISAVLVIAGVSLAMWRRSRARGSLAVQQFGADLLPLVMLFAVSITGVFLTISTHLMRGLHFVFLSQLHAVTVIFTLLYLPFGKFFHIFQR